MWRKRVGVLITHLAAQAWENVCKRFDFEKASTRLGMRMTIDGSGDQFIKMQGLSSYEFCDEDGGAVGMERDEEGVDPQEEMEQSAVVSDALVDSSDEEADGVVGGPSGVASGVAGGQGHAGENDDDDEYEDGFDSSDEDDDTVGSVANNIGHAKAPEGWQIVKDPPALGTEQELHELIGKNILYGHDSKEASGWFIGTVHSRNVTRTDLKKTPSANFVVDYSAKLTDKQLVGKVACELSGRTYGPGEWWVSVEQVGPLRAGTEGKEKGANRKPKGEKP